MEAVLDFILANLPIIICMVVGIGLLIVEIFMPGFGLPGIAGLLLLAVAVGLTWNNYGALAGLAVTIVVLAAGGIAISVSLKSASSGRLSKSPLILKDSQTREEGYLAAKEMDEFLGREGVTHTILRPAGIAEFDGVRLDVVSDGEFIDKGVPVRITKVEGARILVQAIDGRQNA